MCYAAICVFNYRERNVRKKRSRSMKRSFDIYAARIITPRIISVFIRSARTVSRNECGRQSQKFIDTNGRTLLATFQIDPYKDSPSPALLLSLFLSPSFIRPPKFCLALLRVAPLKFVPLRKHWFMNL